MVPRGSGVTERSDRASATSCSLGGGEATSEDLATPLVTWQRRSGRHGLPWQGTRDPYRVWLSEVMLQQTQVSTVLGYYERFLVRFPDVVALAAAPLDEVLALWAGLGYYSRARHLHRCAQDVVALHGGRFPASSGVLQTLPGIGPSTAAAIASFCFDERVSIFDGNVKRVLARWLAFGGDLSLPREERVLAAQAQSLVPRDRVDMPAYTQGLMDLGATVCTPRKPRCEVCPVASSCRGRAQGDPASLPLKTRRTARKQMANGVLWVRCGGAQWLTQRPARGVWGGLWTLPLLESAQAVQAVCQAWKVGPAAVLPSFVHVLTHRDWTFHPHRLEWVADSRPDLTAALGPGQWVSDEDLGGLALPAPMQRLLSLR